MVLKIPHVFEKNYQTNGSPRVFHALKKIGLRISEKRVARLMQENGLRARALKTYSKPGKVKLSIKRLRTTARLFVSPIHLINCGQVMLLILKSALVGIT